MQRWVRSDRATVIPFLTAVLLTIAPGSAAAQEESWKEAERACLGNIVQITNPGQGLVKAGEAYFSPDGASIIFQAVPEGKEHYQIYLMSLADRKPKLVSTGRGECTCGYFHPTQEKILFASSHLDPRLKGTENPEPAPGYQRKGGSYRWSFNPHMDIFEATLDGKILARLTSKHGYDAEGAYDATAQWIAFSSNRSGDQEIYIMRSDGSGAKRLTHAAGYDGGPFISPDGKKIIFRADRRGDDLLQIFVMNLDGSGETQLTDNQHVNWGPFWHPTGKSVIYATSQHGHHNYELYLMNVDTRETFRVTHCPGFDGLPAFSKDGTKLMWTSKRGKDNTSQIFLADFALPDRF